MIPSGTAYIIIALIIFSWIFLVPIILFFVLRTTKKLTKGRWEWKDVFGMMICRTHSGRAYLSMALITFCAYTSGVYGIASLSRIALYVLSAIAYYCIHQYIEKKASWYEFLAVIGAMVFFMEALIHVNSLRIILLAISACIVLGVCIWMWVKCGKMILSVSSFIFIAFIIPSLATGYNVYNVTNEIVLHTYYDAYVNRGVYITVKPVENHGQEYFLYGIRDRYHSIFPAVYERIQPYDWYNHEVELYTNRGPVVYNVNTHQLVHSFTTQDNSLRDYIHFTSCEELQDKGFDNGQIIVMETKTGKVKAMISFGQCNSNMPQKGMKQPLQVLNTYNMILNEGKLYKTLFREEQPSFKVVARSDKTKKIKALFDQKFTAFCYDARMKMKDVSGYYSVQRDGKSHVENICGCFPKYNPQYTFILSLNVENVDIDNHGVLETFRNIVEYLRTGKNALPRYTEKLKKGSAHSRLAQYLLGECYESGLGVKMNKKTAMSLYKCSAENGYALAQWKVYCLYTEIGETVNDGIDYDSETAYSYLLQSATQGYSVAQFSLGSQYAIGDYHSSSDRNDQEEAIYWFRMAEKNGDVTAREYLHNKKYNHEYDL